MEERDGAQTSADSKGAAVQLGEVFRDLMSWGVTLPRWQQELLRRVLHSRTLTQDNIGELKWTPFFGPAAKVVNRGCSLTQGAKPDEKEAP